MEISLPPELQSRVQHEVAAGLFASESAVVQRALNFFFMQRQEDVPHAMAIEMGERIERVVSGEDTLTSGSEFIAEIESEYGFKTQMTPDEMHAIEELVAVLKPRIEAAKRGDFVKESVSDIFEEAIASLRS